MLYARHDSGEVRTTTQPDTGLGSSEAGGDAGSNLIFLVLTFGSPWIFLALILIFFQEYNKILLILITEVFLGLLHVIPKGRCHTCFTLILILLSIMMPTSGLVHYSASLLFKHGPSS